MCSARIIHSSWKSSSPCNKLNHNSLISFLSSVEVWTCACTHNATHAFPYLYPALWVHSFGIIPQNNTHSAHVPLGVFIQSTVHLTQDMLLMSYSVCSFSLWCTSNKTSYSCPTLCVHSIAPQTTHTHYSCLTPHVHSVHSALQTTHTLLKSHCAPIHSMAYLKTAHMLFTPHSMLTHSKVYLKTAHMKFIPHETSYNNTS